MTSTSGLMDDFIKSERLFTKLLLGRFLDASVTLFERKSKGTRVQNWDPFLIEKTDGHQGPHTTIFGLER